MLTAHHTKESVTEVERYQHLLDAVVESVPPYPENRFAGRGIVLCGGGDSYFPCAWVCIQMLRRHGCALPIELWFRGSAEMTGEMMALVEPAGVVCVDAYAMARRYPVRRLDGWELKPYAILNSRFAEVLYLDSDNVALRDPSFLFSLPEYAGLGAVFWPDRYVGPGSGQEWLKRDVWNICRVPYRLEPEVEAGQLLIDKRTCWQALNVAMHLNEHSDFYYSYFYGDKDTFHLAWRRCGREYALAPYPLRNLGRSQAIVQHDFGGYPLFQHRNGAKWSVTRPNACVPGFMLEEECFHSLTELRLLWRPPVRRLPQEFAAIERVGYQHVCSSRFFHYWIERHGARTLEFCPNFRIGAGAAEMEVAWMIEEDKDGELLLSIRNENAPTCFLRQGHDRVWRGRWLVYHRMRVELSPAVAGVVDSDTAGEVP